MKHRIGSRIGIVLVTFAATLLFGIAESGVNASGVARKADRAPAYHRPAKPTAVRPVVGLAGQKASTQRILAKLRNPRLAAAHQAAALKKHDLQVIREFRAVPGLKLLGPRSDAPAKGLSKAGLTARIEALRRSGLFEYVEPDWQVHALQVPPDAGLVNGDLWGLLNTGQFGGTTGVDINVVPAWQITTGTSAVRVGVVDTGIRYSHQDLAANMWINPGEIPGNGIDDDGNGYIDDVHGINAITGSGDPWDDHDHGTHVAGTIAASAFDAGPMVGVAYNVRLVALKFLDSNGSGFVSDAITCIDYAIAHGVRILNNSWGGGGFSIALRNAIQAANAAGMLFVAAAGNSATDTDVSPMYPAGYDVPNVVSVAAIDRTGALASFSNFGIQSVDIAAPGVDILSATADSDSSYATFSGTSMAAPHVSGTAALIASQFPSATIAETVHRLLSTSRSLPGHSALTNARGIPDALASLLVAEDGELEFRAWSDRSLIAGRPATIFVAVNDLTPVVGASVLGSFDELPSQAFADNGLAPDEAANDGVYTGIFTVPSSVATTSLNLQADAPGKNPGSATFSFGVVQPPPNDDFSDRASLSNLASQAIGSNRNASQEPGEPLNPPIAGGRSVWWQWTPGVSGPATITTTGSSYDTTLAVYTGTALANLTLIAANDDAIGLQSAVTFPASAAVPYLIQVDGYLGAQGDIVLNYPGEGLEGSPLIVVQPVGQSVLVGESFSLSVVADGAGPLSYQWFRNSAPIPDATEDLYLVENAAESDSGLYVVEISNSQGSAISNPVFVSVDPVGLRPENDMFSDAALLPGSSGQTLGSSVRATGQEGEPDHAERSLPLASVWYAWLAPADGTLEVNTFGSDFDTTLAVYIGSSVSTLTEIASNDDSFGLQSSVTPIVSAGQAYFIAVDGYAAARGQVVLNYDFTPSVTSPANDDFGNRLPLSGNVVTTGSNLGATAEAGEPDHAGASQPLASVWWSWTAATSGWATVATHGSDFDTTLGIYAGNALASLAVIAANDDFEQLSTSQVTFFAVKNTSYQIAVDGNATAQGNIVLEVALVADSDADGIPDDLDNCIERANPSQLDTDGDGYGNACDPDFNNNGIVDSQDGALLRSRFGSTTHPDQDLNGNGIVDSQDGALLRSLFGQPPGPSALAP